MNCSKVYDREPRLELNDGHMALVGPQTGCLSIMASGDPVLLPAPPGQWRAVRDSPYACVMAN